MQQSRLSVLRTSAAIATIVASALVVACGDSESPASPAGSAASEVPANGSSSSINNMLGSEPALTSSSSFLSEQASSAVDVAYSSSRNSSHHDSPLLSSNSRPSSSYSWHRSRSSAATSSAARYSSKNETLPASSSTPGPVITSSSAPVIEPGLSSSTPSQPITKEVSLDENGFATVADVYHSLSPDEKAVFIIRHSEREDDVAIETELTANGIKMAQDLGATLKSDEEFTYVTSGFVRTNETANQISKGRGEASLPKLITNYDITGNWFLKISADELAAYATKLGMQGTSVELMAHWAYGESYPDALYELEPRAEEFMNTVILKNLPKWKRVSILVSHDIFVMPLAVFGSNKKVALKYHEDYHWINYIAGLAIIIDAQNNLRYVPVKGAESGVIDYLAIYMKEHGLENMYPTNPGRKGNRP